jgi:hypothetical protein
VLGLTKLVGLSRGEAPFIVTRYNSAVHTSKIKDLDKRVGFLDRKLQIVGEYCATPKKWLFWAKQAFKASYGYEWQGDNILIARENLLYTLIDYYEEQFGHTPSLSVQYNFANIISWNIFQMDGLKYVIPLSGDPPAPFVDKSQLVLALSAVEPDKKKSKAPATHIGKYAKIKDWDKNKTVKFVDIANRKEQK